MANDAKTKRLHCLAIALPVQGHINPMVQLARRLASKQCIVTLVNLQSNHDKIVNLLPEPNELDIRFESVPDRVAVPVGSLNIFSSTENRTIFRSAYMAMEQDTIDLLQNKLMKSSACPVTFIIGDVYLPWVANVADSFNLPKVLFSTTCASSLLTDWYIPRLLEDGDIPVRTENLSKPVRAALAGLPSPLHVADLPTYLDTNSQDPAFSNRHAKAMSMSVYDYVLINTSEVLERDALNVLRSQVNKNTLGIGPLLDDSKQRLDAAWTADDACIEWLNTKATNSVLYISYGSIATMPPQQFLELAEGLGSTKWSFLWVVRPNLLAATSDEEKQAKDSAQAVIKQLEKENRACIVAWAPQLEVLAHPSVGGFLTHCGWNSILETVWYGVPVLGWPQLVEQNLVCRMACGEWKVGLSLKDKDSPEEIIDRSVISRSVCKIMESDELRENSRKLQELVKSSGSGELLDSFLLSLSLQK